MKREIDLKQFLDGMPTLEAAEKLAVYIRRHCPDYEHVTDFEVVGVFPADSRQNVLTHALNNFLDWCAVEQVRTGI